MLKLMIYFYLLISMLFLIMHTMSNTYTHLHPITLILMILTNTILICSLMSFWQSNPMYSMLLFLIMISGLIIIFLYFSSLITNSQNKITINKFMLVNFLMNLLMFMYINFHQSLLNQPPIYFYLDTYTTSNINKNMFQNLFMIYSHPYSNFTLLSMLFLLIAMFTIIKMCTIKSASLRKIS